MFNLFAFSVWFDNDILDRSKYWAYTGGALHACTDDCPTNPSVTHFNCEVQVHSVSLKIASYATYPGGIANVKVCLTDTSNNYLGYPTPINNANYTYPKTNAAGSVILTPPKNTAFKIWVDSNKGISKNLFFILLWSCYTYVSFVCLFVFFN